jgi:hypothetical protein
MALPRPRDSRLRWAARDRRAAEQLHELAPSTSSACPTYPPAPYDAPIENVMRRGAMHTDAGRRNACRRMCTVMAGR